MSDLLAWLESHGLGQLAEVFAANDVDLEVLPLLSDDDLKELGLSLGHRRRLQAALKEAQPPKAAPPPESGQEAERRQLTVLFCDLVGSTELSERLDPEALRDLLRRYHDAVTGAVAAFDGHVAKLLGDGVLAYFGWPQAGEDDAERAVRAALRALEEVGAIAVGEESLAARAGIATGPVVIGDMQGETAHERGSIAGATPNLAARLQGAAQPGEVLIHGATRKLLGALFELEHRGAQALKGFAEPVEIWRVAGAAQARSRFEAQHGGGLTAFVGRNEEIELLRGRWDLARRGKGQAVLLSGEAGIGKSRVLREFADGLEDANLEEGMPRSLHYQCSPHEINAAFQPLIAEIAASCAFGPDDGEDARLDKLERALRPAVPESQQPEAAALIAELMGLPSDRYPSLRLPPQRRKQRTVELLVSRLTRLADQGPLLLLFEDLHWVDNSTHEALTALVTQLRALPLLLVMTCRPNFQPRWGEAGHVTRQPLQRLAQDDGRAIAERVAGDKALPDEVMTRILEQTDGVPLFVEELTKTLLEAGFLHDDGNRYSLTGPLPDLAVPETLQDSLMARLDRLAPIKRVVQAAACIGRQFGAGLLSAALPMESADLAKALTQLVAAELIFPLSGEGPDSSYIFKHALVQDAAYASLLTSSRRELHERLAQALEAGKDPDLLELARHHLAAGHHARAAALYLTAGQQALKNSALPEAIGALELGLQAVAALAPSDERDRRALDLRVALGTTRMANFGWAHPSVSEALEPAFPLAHHFADEAALGSILWGLWVHYQTRTNFPRAHEWLEELKKVAGERPQSDLPQVYGMSAGCQDFWEADFAGALAHTDRVKAAYQPQRHARITGLTNHDPLVFSQHWAGSLADWIAGRPARSPGAARGGGGAGPQDRPSLQPGLRPHRRHHQSLLPR